MNGLFRMPAVIYQQKITSFYVTSINVTADKLII